MTTMNTPQGQVPVSTEKRASPSWLVLVVSVVLAIVAGGFAGWFLAGSADDASAYVAGGGELTTRQEQMVELIAESGDAWLTGDAEALKEMFAPNGTWTAFDVTYRMDDGSLQAYIDSTSFPGLELYEPILVRGNQAVMFHNYSNYGDIADVFEFTPEGEVLIVSHVVMVD